MTVRFGVCNWLFPALADPTCCRRLAELQLSSVLLELGSREEGFPLSVPDRIAAWKAEACRYGVELDGVSIRTTADDGFERQEGLQVLHLGLETAKRLQARMLCIPNNRKLADIEREGAFERIAGCLRTLCREARTEGILITTENTLPFPEAQRLFTLVGEPNLRICLDPCNYVMYKNRSPSEVLPDLLPLADTSVHFKDGVGGIPSIRMLGGGEGKIPETVATLKKYAFSGVAIIESIYAHASFHPKATDPYMLLAEDRRYLASLFA